MNSELIFLQIDERGQLFTSSGLITDPVVGHSLLSELSLSETGNWESNFQNQKVIVEPFDQPLVVQKILSGKALTAVCSYDFKFSLDLSNLSADEWDRFHGYTDKKIPFVLSKPAQAQLFDLLEDFDDESISYQDETYDIKEYWQHQPEIDQGNFWTQKYLNSETRWDLGVPSPAFTSYMPQIKLAPSRVIVLGGGRGHDAAFFAQAGHFVTLVDISPEAIKGANEKYGHLKNFKAIEADIFNLPRDFEGNFDLVIEHTCYCAINPARRQELVKTWSRLLTPNGFLFGVFFAMEKKGSPPFGGSEWEVQKRLDKNFRFLYWQRIHNSIDRRMGKEFLVYAQKKT